MANDIQAWADSIGEWQNDARDQITEELTTFCQNIATALVMNSPSPKGDVAPVGRYSTGHFVHNWQVSSDGVVGEIAGTSTKANKVASLRSRIDGALILSSQNIYITNSTEYANAVETGEGWARTPGYHPVQTAYGLYSQGPAPVARTIAGAIS